jgi:ABC-type transport system involved in Fe-S cluster assembly fused permease/ATPase subunit
VLYITFTIVVTNWRTVLRREVNELDSAANIARHRQPDQLTRR